VYIYVSFTGLFRLTLRTSHTSTRHACRPHTLIEFLKKEVVPSVYVGLFYRVLCMYTRLFCRSLYVHFGLLIGVFTRTRTSVVVAGVRMTQVSRKRPVKETYVYTKRS